MKRLSMIAFVLCLLVSMVQAQDVAMTRAYAVQNRPIQEVARELQTALQGKATVTVDSDRNQLLVTARNRIHVQLRQAIAAQSGSTTRSASNSATSAASPPRSHATSRQNKSVERKTNFELPVDSWSSPGASALAQAQHTEPMHVAQLPADTPTAPGEVPVPTRQTEATSDQSRVVSLRHIPPEKLGQSILRLLPRQARTSRSGDQTRITAVGRDGTPIQFMIDRISGQVMIRGTIAAQNAWQRVINAIDRPANTRNDQTQLVSVNSRQNAAVQRAMDIIQQQNAGAPKVAPPRQPVVQWQGGQPVQRPRSVAQNPGAPTTPAGGQGTPEKGLLGPVQIVYLEGLDVIVLRGNPADVERVQAIIDQIESLSTTTEPKIEIYELKNANSQAMVDLVNPLYEQILSPRQGAVSITALVQPNSVLMVGREESVRLVRELVQKLDKPTEPESQFHIFQLKNTSAAEAEAKITAFYEERGGLGTRVRVTSDERSNSIILQAGPRDAEEVGKLLEGMDADSSSSQQSMQVFKLKYSLAEELAPILQQALQTQGTTDGTGTSTGRAIGLSLLTMDAAGKRLIRSGILSEVTVAADTQSNAIIARGPEKTMPLIEALIKQLDELPSEDAEIKVFTLVHGDASLLSQVLNQVFGLQGSATGAGGGGFQGFGGGQQTQGGENPLIPLRFSVDERTNSIVATGGLQDLRVVEAILLRLDEPDVSTRRNTVYRLRYAPAGNVATAINDFLTNQRTIIDVAPNSITPLKQLEREVIVVPELVSNSLIVSATPRYFDDIYQIVQKLDERPPMVMMQLLIAEVELQEFAEFGIEMGLQDSLLFDRGVVDGVATPGFNFNNQPLGNANTTSAGSVATQALSSFAVDRVNDTLGFGGLVVSASSDSVSLLVRALEQDSRLQILSRPQIMTMDNQSAFVQIGSRVPRITSSQLTQFGTINNTILEDVGIVFGVTPRVSPDGLIVMEIDAEKSELGGLNEGIPIAISESGDVIFSPIINTKTAQATIAARHGQTVVFGGLISETDDIVNRGVPYLSDIPLIGDLFSFDSHDRRRSELLFILTPYVVRGDDDINCVNQMEVERMSWCLSDAYRVHGYFDVNACQGNLGNIEGDGILEIHPDETPSAIDFSHGYSADHTNLQNGEGYVPFQDPSPMIQESPVFDSPIGSPESLPAPLQNPVGTGVQGAGALLLPATQGLGGKSAARLVSAYEGVSSDRQTVHRPVASRIPGNSPDVNNGQPFRKLP